MNLELNMSEKPDNVFLLLRKSLIIDGVPCSVRKLSALMQEKLGYCVYYSNISDIENGKKEPSLRALCIYHEFFNVPFEYLLGTGELKNSGEYSKYMNLIASLADSSSAVDKEMLSLVKEITNTDKGLALVYYLNKFFKDELSMTELVKALNLYKTSNFSDETDYQTVRSIIDNTLQENHYE